MKSRLETQVLAMTLLMTAILVVTAQPAASCTRGCGLPYLSISPKSLAFPSQAVRSRSGPMTITLKSVGIRPVVFQGIVSSGPPFFQTNNCPSSLRQFAVCRIYVTFVPTKTGAFSGAITIRDNVSPGKQVVTLSGTGVAAMVSLSSDRNSANAALSAATQPSTVQDTRHQPRYKLIGLGTLGGPISYGSVNGDGFRLLNDSGVVASYADLAVPDPNASFFCYDADCYEAHASLWKHGVITDLGALPENNNSAAGSVNSRGWATGQSQTSTIDPFLGFPEFHAVLWKKGQIIDLGTLRSGTESLGIYVNDAGQVIGFSTVGTEPDPVGFLGFPTHTFLWQNGQKLDIGTLGGDDTFPFASCSHPPEGMVWGSSTTSTTPNLDTGVPTLDPFLWDHGKMTDLGTLGGTNGFAQCANNRHEVIGLSNLAGDLTFHAFVWRNGVMKDLGTLGGDDSEALWINDAGVIAGSADLPTPSIHHAVRWKDGQILDLGTVDGDACSRGRAVNSRGQIVGLSSDCRNALHAFMWEEAGPMLDLNTLVPPGSGLQLTNAININDRGEILAKSDPPGVTPIDDADLGHLVLLVPCDEGRGDCVNELTSGTTTVVPSIQTRAGQQPTVQDAIRKWHEQFTARRPKLGTETR